MKNRTRLTAIAATAMALVMAATATVVAAGPRDRGPNQDEHSFRGRAGQGIGPSLRLRGINEDLQRREVTTQTAQGTKSSRIEQGTFDSADESSLTFSLGNGETVTVVIGDDSRLIGYEEREQTRRGWTRTRLVPTQIAAADIEAGAGIVVWSGSEDGGDFVASRVVVKPAAQADEAEAETADEPAADATGDATDETVTEDAATTDA